MTDIGYKARRWLSLSGWLDRGAEIAVALVLLGLLTYGTAQAHGPLVWVVVLLMGSMNLMAAWDLWAGDAAEKSMARAGNLWSDWPGRFIGFLLAGLISWMLLSHWYLWAWVAWLVPWVISSVLLYSDWKGEQMRREMEMAEREGLR